MLAITDEKRRIVRHIDNLGDPDPHVSCRAQDSLIRHYGARALDELLTACEHPDPVVRFRAVWALGHTRDPRGLETLLRLTADPDDRVRYDATLALGVLGDLRAVRPLVDIWLENDVSRPAAEALSRLGVETLPAVEEVFRRGGTAVRHSAVNVLGGFAEEQGDAQSIELLREALHDPDPDVRADAEFWLKEIEAAADAGG